jgi:penicillin-binding protein 2
MIEKYLKRKITRKDLEKRMLEGSLQAEYDKYIGKKLIDSLINVKPKVDTTEVEN